MALSDYDWRPITFQGIKFPTALMGISILLQVLDITDEDLASWLWRLPICCGVTKRAPAHQCAQCSRQTINLMVRNQQRVLDGITDRLGPHGFEPQTTYRAWISALEHIAVLSESTVGDCVWSAPSHPKDGYKTAADVRQFLANMERMFEEQTKKSNDP